MSKSIIRIISMFLVFALLLTPFSGLVMASGTTGDMPDLKQKALDDATQKRNEVLQEQSLEKKRQELQEQYKEAFNDNDVSAKQYQPNDVVRVIIQLEDNAVIEDLNQLGLKLDNLSSSEIQAKEKSITDQQTGLINQIKSQKISFNTQHKFQYALNAISGDVLYKDIDKIKSMPGVIDVRIANEYYPNNTNESDPDMFFSAPLVGSDDAWDVGYTGEGTVVAIIDTGVNYFHPAFGGTGVETLSLGGKEDLTLSGGYNERVIGGYNWADGNNDIVDRTDSQHGVHVAGTVAGYDAETIINGEPFSGIAPDAQILAEKVFSNDPDRLTTMSDEIIAAFDHAVANGADVINMSLGSTAGVVTEDDPEILAIQNATESGVVVSISAGNSSFSTDGYNYPYSSDRDYATVSSPGIASSSISVAASMGGIDPNIQDTMTYFSSWGPEPGLDFKPNVTAPGGSIYSSVGNDDYTSMDGTSMAAPHVTGASALVIESFQDRGYDYSVDDVKTSLSNTAKVLINPDTNTPYSVRQQGAGRIQVNQAVDSEVLVTRDNGEIGVALKEISGDSTTFTLTAKNISNQDYTYQLSGDVYKDATFEVDGQEYNALTLEEVDGASITFDGGSTLVVPANSEVIFDVTLQLPADLEQNQFVDGWIYLTADEAANTPNIVIPYFGFYGDWNNPSVIDDHFADEDTFYGISGLYDWTKEYFDLAAQIGTNLDGDYSDDYAAFSPDGDYSQDNIIPAYSFLRNSEEVEVNVLDANQQEIRTLSMYNDQRKNDPYNAITYYTSWDGTVDGEIVTDGQYYIQTITKPYGVGSEDYQEELYPIKVDTVDPQITATLDEQDTLQITGVDDSSGIWGYDYEVYDESGLVKSGLIFGDESPEGNIATVDLTGLGDNAHIYVIGWDNAGNATVTEILDGSFAYHGTSFSRYDDTTIYFYWYASDEVADIQFIIDNGEPISVEKDDNDMWRSYYSIPFDYGDHTVIINILDVDGNVIETVTEDISINALQLISDDTISVTNEYPNVNIEYFVWTERAASVVLSQYETGEVLDTVTDLYYGEYYFYLYDAPLGSSTVVIEVFDDNGQLLGYQEVLVNNVKTFDVRFEYSSYYVKDQSVLPISFSVTEDVYSVKLDVYDENDNPVISDISVYDLGESVTDTVYNLDLTVFDEYIFYTLNLEAYDAIGESLGSDVAELFISPTGVLSFTDDNNYYKTNADSFTINWGYDEGVSVTEEVYYLDIHIYHEQIGPVDHISLNPGDTAYTIDMSSYQNEDRLSITLTSVGSNLEQNGSLHFELIKDLAAPVWFIDEPLPYTIYSGNSNLGGVYAYTYDMDLDPNSVTLYIPGMDEPILVDVTTDYYGNVYEVFEVIQFTEDGLQNVELRYQDVLGNQGYHNRKVFVDLTSPEITLNSPNVQLTQTSSTAGNLVYEGQVSTSQSTLSLSGIVSDSLSSFQLWIDDDQVLGYKPSKMYVNSVDQRAFSQTVALEYGLNEITLLATDGSGNSSTITLNVTRPTPSSSTGGGSTIVDTGEDNVSIITEDGEEIVIDTDLSSQITDPSISNVKIDLTEISILQYGELTLSLDDETINELINANKGLTIEGSDFTIEIPASELASMLGENGFNITIKAENLKEEAKVKIQSLETSKIVSNAYTITFDGELKNPITISLKYNNAQDPRKVSAYQKVDDAWQHTGSLMDWSNNQVKLSTTQSGTFAAIEYNKQFDDTLNHWAQDEIEVMTAHHVINGMTEDNFDPDGEVTRAQFVKMLVEMINLDVSGEYSNKYKDVSSDSWYAPYIEAASKAGIINGYSDGTFDPDAKLSRQDMVVMLMRALEKEMPEVLDQNVGNVTFNDEAIISDYAKKSVDLAADNGIIRGLTETEFAPNVTATRAQAATTIYRLFFE